MDKPHKSFIYASPFVYIVGIFLYASVYAFPQTDDFCTFGRLFSSNGNPLSESYFLYKHWTGRYSSSFFISLPAWISSISPLHVQYIYKIFVLAYLAAIPISIYFFLRTIGVDLLFSRLASLMVSSIIFLIIPSKIELLYWLTGSAVYLVPIAFFFVLAAALENQLAKPIVYYNLAIFAIIILVGMNELIAISAGILIIAHAITNFTRIKTDRQKYLILFTIFILALAVTVFAPGNFARDAKDSSLAVSNKHNIQAALVMGMSSLKNLWNYNFKDYAGVLLYGSFAMGSVGVLLAIRGISIKWRAVTPLMATALISIPIQFFIYSFLSGDIAPSRILNQSTALLWAPTMIFISVLFNNTAISRLRARNLPHLRNCCYGVLIIMGILVVSQPAFSTLNGKIRSFAGVWAQEHALREDMIRSSLSSGKRDLRVTHFSKEPGWPPIFQGADITNDPKNWINQCVANYYKIERIQLE
ncbi:hypothetical protein GSY71_18005 [Pusillimonas sp. TS35]|nr:hypothetical protein [Pusillimonas sp. TS35]